MDLSFSLPSFQLSFLATLDRPPEPIRFRARLYDVSAIRNPIDQRFAQPVICEDLRPFRKWKIGRDDQGCSFSPIGDNLEQ